MQQTITAPSYSDLGTISLVEIISTKEGYKLALTNSENITYHSDECENLSELLKVNLQKIAWDKSPCISNKKYRANFDSTKFKYMDKIIHMVIAFQSVYTGFSKFAVCAAQATAYSSDEYNISSETKVIEYLIKQLGIK